MPIIRHGYVSDEEKAARQSFYNSTQWKTTRKAVLHRDGHRCRSCGRSPAELGRPLDVCHRGRTLPAIMEGRGLVTDDLVSMCRRCHSGYAAGSLPWPG